jgi:hypothetical protein
MNARRWAERKASRRGRQTAACRSSSTCGATAVTEEAEHVGGPESLLDGLLPRFDVRQSHEAWVPAPPAVVYSAVKQVTGREVRVLMPLEFLRWLPGFLIGRRPFWPDPSAPLLAGFTVGVVALGERPGTEVVAGAVGRFWRTVGNEAAPVRTRSDFLAFSEPGYTKAAIAFTVFPEREGTRVKTETRVVGTSAEATRSFRRYWLVIRPASDAIRRSWLAAICRRALRALATTSDGMPTHGRSWRSGPGRRPQESP